MKVYKYFKRLFDVLFSVILLFVLSPFFFIIPLLIIIDSRGNPFFVQKRLGVGGKPFNFIKFRTMCTDAEKGGVYSNKNDPRITKIGKILRKTSIDEIPQLLNILCGQMSFIGPRPILTYHPKSYEEYTPKEKKVFEVRPGLTGYAQIHGRKTLDWQARFELNEYYVDHLSFGLDLKIFFLTFPALLKGSTNNNRGKSISANHLITLYISNNPIVAQSIEEAGIDYLFIDMEYMGKDERQKGLDTVKNHHTINDIKNVRKVLKETKLLVRINPINKGSKNEINRSIAAGADAIMLPMFKSCSEVKKFLKYTKGRVETWLLLETKEAVSNLENILKENKGIDRIHIGLNDLHLSYKVPFMFDFLTNGILDKIINILKDFNIPYGFGGVSKLGDGDIKSERIIIEHYYFGSTSAILSRGFCNYEKCVISNIDFDYALKNELKKFREYEMIVKNFSIDVLKKEHEITSEQIKKISDLKNETINN